ncbi:SAM-dependent methyltransferase [Sneathiella glossodoripedis]|uniref:SAM-dependent methyltransferase n=1 Tax=Sneathiella glossodoripedis TaxID=418853 RepID=UPI0034E26F31
MIKPQFEAGPQNVGKGGIVKSNDVKKQVIGDIVHWIETLPGWKSLGTIESPIKGADGNQEFLLGARYDA